MSVVELDVDVRLLVDQVISSSSRGQPNEFPEVTAQLVAPWSLHFSSEVRGKKYWEAEGNKELTDPETASQHVWSREISRNLVAISSTSLTTTTQQFDVISKFLHFLTRVNTHPHIF